MTAVDWRIPPSVLRLLERAPSDRPVAVLIRHSVRDELPDGEAGYVLPITETGRRLARELGARLGPRLKSLRASPLVRTVQTAEAMRDGAGACVAIGRDNLLGDPGVFVVDGRRAGRHFREVGHVEVMRHLVSGEDPLPGLARAEPAARFLVQHMLAAAGDTAGLHAFVTHDSLVTTTAAHLLGRPLGPDAFPWYLEAAFFWRTADGVVAAYRDHETERAGSALCSLDEVEMIELARREVARTVGPDCAARFFLGGGAFKTLLTGQAARDIDLWAPSPQDRAALVETLVGRGAVRLPERPYTEAFEIAGRVIEISRKVDPPTLSERLARADIALSAVGVEHRPGDRFVAMVHPLAQESVRRREVLLLKPLANWKYALTTLERMRRYAQELGWAIPPEEDDEVWRVFDAQDPEMQQGMLDRHATAGRGGFGVMKEATCRRR